MTRATSTPAPAKEVSYEEYMAMPESKQHVEVVDGVLIVMPSPSFPHQGVQDNIAFSLRVFDPAGDVGRAIVAPADLIIRKRPKLRVRQPDVMFFTNEKAGFRVIGNLRRVLDEGIAPAVAVEVLSPGQTEATLAEKLSDYASIGVDEVWLIDPEEKAVRVLMRDGGHYREAGRFAMGEVVRSAVLPELALAVAAIFG